MSRSAYGRQDCPLCGRTTSAAGFARYQHMKGHEHRGHVEEVRKRKTYELKTTGERRSWSKPYWRLSEAGAARLRRRYPATTKAAGDLIAF